MNAIVEQALRLWGLEGADYRLIAARENAVYRIDHGGRATALRLHRVGYRSDPELRSELQWMAAVAAGGIGVPAPVPASDGRRLHVVEGVQVDMLTWLNGASLTAVLQDSGATGSAPLFHQLGREMAALHDICDRWTPPEGFTRCAWDRPGLLGEAPLWGRFWDHPMLDAEDRALFRTARQVADANLADIEAGLDFGLIHADLVGENVMVDEGRIRMIDFDDGGFGFRLFDIATALVKNLDRPDYPDLKAALIEGYLAVRAIDLSAFDLLLMIRAATYVGWNIERISEDGARARSERVIRTARTLARAYLA